MLQFVKVQNSEQIKNLLKSYDPLKDTWIVSDLKSKQEIQAEAIQKHGFFTDDAIMRVSDFWRLWIRRLEPTLQVVSSDFITLLVQMFIEQYGKQLDLLESENSTLTKSLQEFAPLLLHPESHEVITEWLNVEYEKNNKPKKWQKWFQISKLLMQFLVQQKNVIDSRWSAAYLQSRNIELINWHRKIYVDLGSELSSVEMGLLKIISQKQDVIIVAPSPEWEARFPFLLSVYKDNYGYGQTLALADLATLPTPLQNQQFIRLSTQLAEVKFAVAKIRQWADAGVPLNQIAIVAADIEKYWPVLQTYLKQEGLPCRKDTVAKINSLGDIQNFLAALKNYSQDVSWESLERSLFSTENVEYDFEKFKALFYQLYDEDDLSRDLKIKKLYFKKIDFNSEIDRDEFLAFVVKIWMNLPPTSSKEDLFELVLKDIIKQSLNVKMKMNFWVQFLKKRLSSQEKIIERGSTEGLNVLSLMSAHMLNCEYKIYIGLNDELYAKKQMSVMNAKDAHTIKHQFDLNIDCSEESYLDFNLRWQSLSNNQNTIFTSAHLSFNSDPLNAALFFIENNPVSPIQSPPLTRFDEIQKNYAHIEQLQQTNLQAHKDRIQQDVAGYNIQLNPDKFKKLSVGDIENYAQCSFKLLAGKGFRLRNYSQVGLDLDHREKGTLAHALFQFIVENNLITELSELKVLQFLEQHRIENSLYINLDNIWNIQKNKYLNLAKKFVDFEKQRAALFSIQSEKSVQIFFDTQNNCFTANEPTKGFCFNMRIDRIDLHKQKKYSIIYDYKSSSDDNHKVHKWINHYQFQMLLYMMAFKLTQPEAVNIKGALYYYYKKFKINSGYIDKDIGKLDFEINGNNKSLMTEDKLEVIQNDFLKIMSECLTQLEAGQFATKPYQTDLCDKCDWSKLCRAPHLM